jgi:hypothetical protein
VGPTRMSLASLSINSRGFISHMSGVSTSQIAWIGTPFCLGAAHTRARLMGLIGLTLRDRTPWLRQPPVCPLSRGLTGSLICKELSRPELKRLSLGLTRKSSYSLSINFVESVSHSTGISFGHGLMDLVGLMLSGSRRCFLQRRRLSHQPEPGTPLDLQGACEAGADGTSGGADAAAHGPSRSASSPQDQ